MVVIHYIIPSLTKFRLATGLDRKRSIGSHRKANTELPLVSNPTPTMRKLVLGSLTSIFLFRGFRFGGNIIRPLLS